MEQLFVQDNREMEERKLLISNQKPYKVRSHMCENWIEISFLPFCYGKQICDCLGNFNGLKLSNCSHLEIPILGKPSKNSEITAEIHVCITKDMIDHRSYIHILNSCSNLNFFRLYFHNFLSCVYKCDDQSCLRLFLRLRN